MLTLTKQEDFLEVLDHESKKYVKIHPDNRRNESAMYSQSPPCHSPYEYARFLTKIPEKSIKDTIFQNENFKKRLDALLKEEYEIDSLWNDSYMNNGTLFIEYKSKRSFDWYYEKYKEGNINFN